MDTNASFWLPPAKSTLASQTDPLFHFINITGGLILLGIVIVIGYCIIKYRRTSEDDITPNTTHNDTLEITWSIIPLFLVLIVFSWGFQGFMYHRTMPDNAYEIHVTGKSWLWEFTYPNGTTMINELHVPEDRPVKLVMKSEDVIHSFFVPDFRVKHDVLPGRYTSLWFEATDPGTALIFCTEFCGNGHSDMLATIIIHQEDDFKEWLESGVKAPDDIPLAEYGEQLYKSANCATCHSNDGSRIVGPSFKGLWEAERNFEDGTNAVADANYLRQSILEPMAKIVATYPPAMPSYQGTLKDFQVDALIEYIKTLE